MVTFHTFALSPDAASRPAQLVAAGSGNVTDG